jgi:hypothetical protein
MLIRPDFGQPPDVQCHRQERLAACEDPVQRIAALSMKYNGPSISPGIGSGILGPNRCYLAGPADQEQKLLIRAVGEHG